MKSFSLLTNEGLVVEVDSGGPALGYFGHMRRTHFLSVVFRHFCHMYSGTLSENGKK